MRNTTPVVNISRTNIHYECKKQKPCRRIKTTPLQILDHALPYLLLWQSPMHCAVRCIFTYTLGTGVAHIFAKFSAVEQCVRYSSVGVLDDPLHALRLDLEASMQRWTAEAHSAGLCVYNCNCSTLSVFSSLPPLRKLSISELLIHIITLSLTCKSSKEIFVTFCVAKSQ